MTAALVAVDEETAPKDWVPEAGYANRARRDRRKKATCDVCGRPVWGDGRLCSDGYVNEVAPVGCWEWSFSVYVAYFKL